MTNQSGSHWEPQPAGAAWIASQLDRFRNQHPDVKPFESLLREKTGTRIVDWIDHLHVTSTDGIEAAGFVKAADDWYEHPGALLPVVKHSPRDRMMLRVDSVSDFAIANCHCFAINVEGAALDVKREATFCSTTALADFGVIERNGCSIRSELLALSDRQKVETQNVRELLRHRQRRFLNVTDAFQLTQQLVTQAINRVGRDIACHLFFEAERAYWQARNRAGRVLRGRNKRPILGIRRCALASFRSVRAMQRVGRYQFRRSQRLRLRLVSVPRQPR